jgi:hypothetical protein
MNVQTRRARRGLLLAAGAWALFGAAVSRAASLPPMQVWKAPTCGCCKDWIAILQKDGFAVEVFDQGNHAARARAGLPPRYGSCHTALIGGYVIEGHVPPREIRRLLAEKPAALGLAVPGMPVGSPGMDGPEYRGRRDPYDVLLVARDGTSTVYAGYR